MKSFFPPALLLLGMGLLYSNPTLAAEEPVLSSGDTAWMLTSTALVLFMTIPGLSLFYAGMVRSKNVLSVLTQCFAITALATILWSLFGYSLAFTDGGDLNAFIGGGERLFLAGLTPAILKGTIPEGVFMTFQMTFAIITPALVVGAFAERMKFSALLLFMSGWLTLVYVPVCHWVWGGGWLANKGVLDFAGGTVVHINAGIAGLVAALVLGRRKGFPNTAMPPHSLPLTITGAGILWVGWFGFNAGSQLAADGVAGMAMVVTQIASSGAAISWMGAEWLKHGKPSSLGLVSGAVGGLVAITPASGFVGPMGALFIGIAAGLLCFWGATGLKRKAGYDDSLDAFGVHGIGGLSGAILTGVFIDADLGGKGLAEGMTMASQVWAQIMGAGVTVVYCAVISYLLLKLLDRTVGLRVSDEAETMGLDLSLHDERGYN